LAQVWLESLFESLFEGSPCAKSAQELSPGAMGPPCQSWRKEVAVFRHGMVCCHDMLTQCAEKAPKWTMGQKLPGKEEKGQPGPTGVKAPDKFPRDGVFSFGNPGRPARPSSAPPGPRFNKPLDSTTPKYSFGTTKRPPAFPGEPGPGPHQGPRKDMPGPKFSMPGRYHTKGEGGPGPGQYRTERPRRPQSAPGPRWGPRPRGGEPPSADGPGPSYVEKPKQGGPKFSMRPRLDPKLPEEWRQLGPPYTYFGYDDFGHSECVHCDDIPNPFQKPVVYAKLLKQSNEYMKNLSKSDPAEHARLLKQSQGGGYPQKDSTDRSSERSTKPKRPSSAPGGRSQRIPTPQRVGAIHEDVLRAAQAMNAQ